VSITATQLKRQLGRLAADFPTESDALRRRLFWRLATRFTPLLAVDREGMRLFVSTADRVIGRRLFVYHRTPETDIVAAIDALRAIPGATERLRGRAVIEIGANIGSHTVQLLTHYGAERVTAIEPNPDNCALLRQNVLANGVHDRVTLLPVAVSDNDGFVDLELSDGNSGDHRVRVPGAAGDQREGARATIRVRSCRFDSLIDDGEIDLEAVGLIWMDAQGHEGHILAGARRLLESEIPIMMEYWPYGLRRAGGLELLHRLVAEHYSEVLDIAPPGGGPPRTIPAARLCELESLHGWSVDGWDPEAATDVILRPSTG
jgi:FkbM family methyltransferase